MKNQLIKLLKETKGVIVKGNFDLTAGNNSGIYIDIKRALGYPPISELILSLMYEKFVGLQDFVAGSGWGGCNLASQISNCYGIPSVGVRLEKRSHGTKKQIEGYPPKEFEKGVLVDDVFTTGSSLRKTKEILDANKIAISGAYVVVKRGNPKSPLGFPVYSLLALQDLID